MNNSLRDVAKILYNVPDFLSCKICLTCKEIKGNEQLSCVDCIENGLRILVDKTTPKNPYHGEWGYRCPNCNGSRVYDYEYNNEFNHCSDCGQKLDWSEVLDDE